MTDSERKTIEDLVIFAAKLQIDVEERDVDRMIGAIPEHVVETIVTKCRVDERYVDMSRILTAAKNYKKRISR